MEFALTALPLLVFLACPLMMVFCMAGMRKAGCGAPKGGETQGSREERIAALEGQLAAIRTELSALGAAEAAPSGDANRGANRPGATAVPEMAYASQRSA